MTYIINKFRDLNMYYGCSGTYIMFVDQRCILPSFFFATDSAILLAQWEVSQGNGYNTSKNWLTL